MQHSWYNSTLFYQQVKESGIIPPSIFASSLPLVCCPQREFVETLSPIAEYVGNDTLQQAGNPLLILSWNIHTIRKLASEFSKRLSIILILFFNKTIFAFARAS